MKEGEEREGEEEEEERRAKTEGCRAAIQPSESNISGGKTGEWATLIKVFT